MEADIAPLWGDSFDPTAAMHDYFQNHDGFIHQLPDMANTPDEELQRKRKQNVNALRSDLKGYIPIAVDQLCDVNHPNPIATEEPDKKKGLASPGLLASNEKLENGTPPVVGVLANMEDNVVYKITTIHDVYSDGHLTDKHVRRYSIRTTVRLRNQSQVRQDLRAAAISMNCQSGQLKKPERLRFDLDPAPLIKLEQTMSNDVEFSFEGAGSSSGAFPYEEGPAPPAVCSEMNIKLRFISEDAKEYILMVPVPDKVLGIKAKE
jgi:hypothetical protein